MRNFFDCNGNAYSLRLTVGALERFKTASGVDLLSGNPSELAKVFDDQLALIKGVAGICSEQLEKNGFRGDCILDAFDGDSCLSVFNAFSEEIKDFFHKSGRNAVASLLRKMAEIREGAEADAVKKVEAFENSVGDLPEEQELTREI